MDALVYEDHPLATYFEGEAIPYDISRNLSPLCAPFAPSGLPDIRSRLKAIRQNSFVLKPSTTEQLFERFRYVIVASQLLSDENGSQTAASNNEPSDLHTSSLKGVIATAVLSFLAAWSLHYLKTRRRKIQATSWLDLAIYATGIILIGTGLTYLAQRQYTKHIQGSAVRTLSNLVDSSHTFDKTASNTVRFIQEVEVVARGYELSMPLPPVSRLEDRQAIRRCRALRSELATALRSLTILFVESHNAMQPHVSSTDLQQYYDIYEISLVEYSQAIELDNMTHEEQGDSLMDIRFSLHLHALARKVFLCDLLALRPSSRLFRLRQWRGILQVLSEVQAEIYLRRKSLLNNLSIEEWGSTNPDDRRDRRSLSASSQEEPDVSSDNPNLKVRMRRFDDITQSIRALNAKVHLLKEEITGLNTASTEDTVVANALAKHYEALGADIRSLVVDWEKGRNTLLLDINSDLHNPNRYSRSSSCLRSPQSPSPSLGGTTIVDGGPAEALRLLSGDSDADADSVGGSTLLRKTLDLDEQVFEAIAVKPTRKRMSIAGLTREEKLAKLQEDRRKRATIQEQADNTTSMLRELQMVIKHRPKGSMGISSGTQRVTSI